MDIGQNMNRPLKWMALAGVVWLGFARAAAEEFVERPANPAQEGHRFLFVVETSSGNRKFEGSNRQAVFDLIVGGVNGNMRSGDTYGIWTFNDEVKAGEFPLTIWEKNQALDLAGQAAAFLQKQKYTKKASPSFLVDALRRLSDRVGDFNVFIVSSGEDPISGTPFDQNINAAYKALEKQSVRTGRPMVTTFAVRKSRPVRSGVVLAGDRIVLPDRPPEMPGAPSKRTSFATNVTASAASPGSATTAGTAAAPRKKVMQIVTKTNAPATTPVVVTASASTNVASASENGGLRTEDSGRTNAVVETAVTSVTTSATTVSVPTVPASLVGAAPMPTPAPDPLAAPTSSAVPISNPPAPSAASAVTMSVPTLPSAALATSNAAPPSPTEARERRVQSAPGSNPVLAAAPPAGNLPAPLLVPAGPATATALPATIASNKTTAAAMLVMAREALLGANTNSQGTDVPAVQGIVVQVRTMDGLSARVLLAIGGTLLGAACFLLVLLLRRSPSSGRGSLITQAMRPERKA
jgi:hypothetical protein